MFIEEPKALEQNFIRSSVSEGGRFRRIDKGIYEIGHFGGSDFLPEYDDSYCGVADNYHQVFKHYREVTNNSDKQFIITFTTIHKSKQPSDGGWRWAKWGDYIGDKEPQCEYLYDEPEIDKIIVYTVYKRLKHMKLEICEKCGSTIR